MCRKCRENCQDCKALIQKYGEENLNECPYCGHYYHGQKCSCRDYRSGKVSVYEVVVYKHQNGSWIPKYHVTEPDLKEMQESPFVQVIRILTEEEWRQLQENAQKSGVKLSALLEGYP